MGSLKTVHEVSRLTGVSIRTLQYYDSIGLLPASTYSAAGYRLYDDTAIARLGQILLFRELEFPLKEIQFILNGSAFDRSRALDDQIALLTMKRDRLERLLTFAKGLKRTGDGTMNFEAFDRSKMEQYEKEAKQRWGQTNAYREYEEKHGKSEDSVKNAAAAGLMTIFEEFGMVRTEAPNSVEAQRLVKKLQDYISAHFYTCTNEILCGLGQMYAAGGELTENIDRAGGSGTAAFVNRAIQAFCG